MLVNTYLPEDSNARMKKTLPTVRISSSERKASILESATSLFAAKGFNGTKTREIAKRAGVSEALVFRHFPTKNHLYAAIMAEQSPVPGLLADIRKLTKQEDDLAVFTHIAKAIVYKVSDPNLLRLLLFSALEGHELSDMFFKKHVRVFYDFLGGYIDQRIHEGVFRPVPPLVSARAFMGMLIYHRLLSQLFGVTVPQSFEQIVNTFVTVFLNGLRVPNRKKRMSKQVNGRSIRRTRKIKKT